MNRLVITEISASDLERPWSIFSVSFFEMDVTATVYLSSNPDNKFTTPDVRGINPKWSCNLEYGSAALRSDKELVIELYCMAFYIPKYIGGVKVGILDLFYGLDQTKGDVAPNSKLPGRVTVPLNDANGSLTLKYRINLNGKKPPRKQPGYQRNRVVQTYSGGLYNYIDKSISPRNRRVRSSQEEESWIDWLLDWW